MEQAYSLPSHIGTTSTGKLAYLPIDKGSEQWYVGHVGSSRTGSRSQGSADMTLQAIELRIEKPDLMAFVTGLRAGDVVGKVGYKKILGASPDELDTLAKFVLSVKALKEYAG